MREILFRGKTTGGEWYVGKGVDLCFSKAYILIEFTDGGRQMVDDGEVIPETVGQFTGLTDKNGKKIFEGDIVRILGNQYVEDWKNVDYNALIAFIDGGFCAIDGTVEEHGFRRYALARLDFSLEVIGNIHDNPELLEVK